MRDWREIGSEAVGPKGRHDTNLPFDTTPAITPGFAKSSTRIIPPAEPIRFSLSVGAIVSRSVRFVAL
jgi:hypothetical protein